MIHAAVNENWLHEINSHYADLVYVRSDTLISGTSNGKSNGKSNGNSNSNSNSNNSGTLPRLLTRAEMAQVLYPNMYRRVWDHAAQQVQY